MKQQLVLSIGGLVILASLFVFGNTVAKKAPASIQEAPQAAAFNIQQFITEEKKHLGPGQSARIAALENNISRGDVKGQQIAADTLLANFWRDSVGLFEPYVFYLSEASKLENSEKSLTFAARLLAAQLRTEQDISKRVWMADEAIGLFEKALVLSPGNPNLEIEKGACYVYGYAVAGRAEKAMTGILKLKEIADKDSNNLSANLLVGIGGYISGQYDKAIARLERVLNAEPNNLEALSYLVEAYAGKGDKPKAIQLLEMAKKMVNDPAFRTAADKRINELK